MPKKWKTLWVRKELNIYDKISLLTTGLSTYSTEEDVTKNVDWGLVDAQNWTLYYAEVEE